MPHRRDPHDSAAHVEPVGGLRGPACLGVTATRRSAIHCAILRAVDVDDFVERFAPWRAKHVRTAYIPELGPSARSRFGGAPDMPRGEGWPACAECKRPMLFLLQLDLASLPVPVLGGPGLLQLFMCRNDDGACESWAAFSGASLARIVSGDELERGVLPPDVEEQPERGIVAWSAVDDTPNSQEHEALGIRYDYDFGKRQVRIACPELGFDEGGLDIDRYSAEAISSARGGDKLLGWPQWVQGAEYPSCPHCGERMEMLLQVDSEEGVALMFGDLGTGHITQCPKHPHVLGFGWAC